MKRRKAICKIMERKKGYKKITSMRVVNLLPNPMKNMIDMIDSISPSV